MEEGGNHRHPRVVPLGLPLPPKNLVPSFYRVFKSIQCRYALGRCRWGPMCIYTHEPWEMRHAGYGPTPEEAAQRKIKLPAELIAWWEDVRHTYAALFEEEAAAAAAGLAPPAPPAATHQQHQHQQRQALHQGGQGAHSGSYHNQRSGGPAYSSEQVEAGLSKGSYQALLHMQQQQQPAPDPAASSTTALIAYTTDVLSSLMEQVASGSVVVQGPAQLRTLLDVKPCVDVVNTRMREMADGLLALGVQQEELEAGVGPRAEVAARLAAVVQQRQQQEEAYLHLAPQVKQMNSLLKKLNKALALLPTASEQPPPTPTQHAAPPPHHHHQYAHQQQQQQEEAGPQHYVAAPHAHAHAPASATQAQPQHAATWRGSPAPHTAAGMGRVSDAGTVAAQYGLSFTGQQLPLQQRPELTLPLSSGSPGPPGSLGSTGLQLGQQASSSGSVNGVVAPPTPAAPPQQPRHLTSTASAQQRPVQPHQGSAVQAPQLAVQPLQAAAPDSQGSSTQPGSHGSRHAVVAGSGLAIALAPEALQQALQQLDLANGDGASADQQDSEEGEDEEEEEEEAVSQREAQEAARLAEAARVRAAEAEAQRQAAAEAAALKREGQAWVKEFKAQHLLWTKIYAPVLSKPGTDEAFSRCATVLVAKPGYENVKAAVAYLALRLSTPSRELPPPALRDHLDLSHLWLLEQQPGWGAVPRSLGDVVRSLLWEMGVQQKLEPLKTVLAYLWDNSSMRSEVGVGPDTWIHMQQANTTLVATLVKTNKHKSLDLVLLRYDMLHVLRHEIKHFKAIPHSRNVYSGLLTWAQGLGAGVDTLQVLLRHGETAGLFSRDPREMVLLVHHLLSGGYPPAVVTQYLSSAGISVRECPPFHWHIRDACRPPADEEDEVDSDDDEAYASAEEEDFEESEEEDEDDDDDGCSHATSNRMGNYLHAVLQSAAPNSSLQMVKDALNLCRKETSRMLEAPMHMAGHGLMFVNSTLHGRAPLAMALLREPPLPQLEEVLHLLAKYGAMPLTPGPSTCPAGHKLYQDHPLMVAITRVGEGKLDVKVGSRAVKVLASYAKELVNKVQPQEYGYLNALALAALQPRGAADLVAALMSASPADPLWPLTSTKMTQGDPARYGWVTPLALALEPVQHSDAAKAMLVNWSAPMLLDALHPGHVGRYLHAINNWILANKDVLEIVVKPLARLNKTWHERYMAALLLPGHSLLRDFILDHATTFKFEGVCVLDAMQRTGLTAQQVETMLARGAHVTVTALTATEQSTSTSAITAAGGKQLAASGKGAHVRHKSASDKVAASEASSATGVGGAKGVKSTSSGPHGQPTGSAQPSTASSGKAAGRVAEDSCHVPGSSSSLAKAAGPAKQGAATTTAAGTAAAAGTGGPPQSLADAFSAFFGAAHLRVSGPLAPVLQAQKKPQGVLKVHPQGWRQSKGIKFGRHAYKDNLSKPDDDDEDGDDDVEEEEDNSDEDDSNDDDVFGKKGRRRRGRGGGGGSGGGGGNEGRHKHTKVVQPPMRKQPLPSLQVLLQTLLQRCNPDPVLGAYALDDWFYTLLWSSHTGLPSSPTALSAQTTANGASNGARSTASAGSAAPASSACDSSGGSGVVSGPWAAAARVAAGEGHRVSAMARRLLLALLQAKDQKGRAVRSVHLPQLRLQACHLFGHGEGAHPDVAQLLRILLASGAVDANERDPARYGMTLLHLAAADYASEAAAVLLKAGADPLATILPRPAPTQASSQPFAAASSATAAGASAAAAASSRLPASASATSLAGSTAAAAAPAAATAATTAAAGSQPAGRKPRASGKRKRALGTNTSNLYADVFNWSCSYMPRKALRSMGGTWKKASSAAAAAGAPSTAGAGHGAEVSSQASHNMHDRLVGSTALHMCVRAQLSQVEDWVEEGSVQAVLEEPAAWNRCPCCFRRVTHHGASYGVEPVPKPPRAVVSEQQVPGQDVIRLLATTCPELVHMRSTPKRGVSAVTPGGLYLPRADAPHVATCQAVYDRICAQVTQQQASKQRST